MAKELFPAVAVARLKSFLCSAAVCPSVCPSFYPARRASSVGSLSVNPIPCTACMIKTFSPQPLAQVCCKFLSLFFCPSSLTLSSISCFCLKSILSFIGYQPVGLHQLALCFRVVSQLLCLSFPGSLVRQISSVAAALLESFPCSAVCS